MMKLTERLIQICCVVITLWIFYLFSVDTWRNMLIQRQVVEQLQKKLNELEKQKPTVPMPIP